MKQDRLRECLKYLGKYKPVRYSLQVLLILVWELMKTKTKIKNLEKSLEKKIMKATKKLSSPKGKKAEKKIKKVMKEFKEGELHSGSKKGPEVKNKKQAVAIALSEARKAKKK